MLENSGPILTRLWIKVEEILGYLELQDIYEQNFNGYTHVFEVELFNGVVDNVTGSRVIPEIDMATAETGSYNTILYST